MQIAAGGPQGGQQSTVNLIPGLQALLAQQAPNAPGSLPGEPDRLSCFVIHMQQIYLQSLSSIRQALQKSRESAVRWLAGFLEASRTLQETLL